MSWNTQGEFMYRGSAINDSNIVDLIGDLMRSRKSVTWPPQGMDMFLTALKDTNTPRELILNRHRYDGYLRDTYRSENSSAYHEAIGQRQGIAFKAMGYIIKITFGYEWVISS